MKVDSNQDQVVLVDPSDQEIGVMDKVEAHRGAGQLHRATSVILKNNRGQWLMQQRSQHKIVGAQQWANTCCGNVRPGESYEQCAYRRLYEELGITGVQLTKVGCFQYQVQCNAEFSEHELDTVFVGEYDGPVFPNEDEVMAYRWVSAKELRAELTHRKSQFVPWLPLVLEQQQAFSADRN